MNNPFFRSFYFFLPGTPYRIYIIVDRPKPSVTFITGKGDGGVHGLQDGRVTVVLADVSPSSVCFLHGLMCMIRGNMSTLGSFVSVPCIPCGTFLIVVGPLKAGGLK